MAGRGGIDAFLNLLGEAFRGRWRYIQQGFG